MKDKVLTTPALVILSTLITLSALVGIIRGKMIKILKVLNILMVGDLSILPVSMRSANNSASPRLARTSAYVI